MNFFGERTYGEHAWFPGIAALIAGYLGYSRPDDRGTSDRRFRDDLKRRLVVVRKRLLSPQENDTSQLDQIDDVIEKLDTLRRKVAKADYSVPFSGTAPIQEKELDALYAYDGEILECAKQLEVQSQRGELEFVAQLIDKMSKLFDSREDFIVRLRPV